jgi:hypothetical protein
MNKNEINNKNVYARGNLFKISENEIYMIKESNIRRVHDIMKNTSNAKPNDGCSVIM